MEKRIALSLAIAIFFGIGTLDKIVSQTEWNYFDIFFVICFCVSYSYYAYMNKNYNE